MTRGGRAGDTLGLCSLFVCGLVREGFAGKLDVTHCVMKYIMW